MKRTITLLTLLTLTINTFSQSDTLLRYLDADLKPATKKEEVAHEVITIITRMEDGNFMVQDFLYTTGKKIQQQYRDGKDSLTLIGPYISYYSDGVVKTKGNYVAGKKMGIWRTWHGTKAIADSCFYNDLGNIQGSARGWWDTGELRDSAFYFPDSNGHAYKREFFSDGTISGEGPAWNALSNGQWKHYYRSGKPSSIETYDKGQFKAMQCFNEDGTVYTGKCEPEIDAEFPGGIKDWQNYVINGVARRIEAMTRDRATGKAVVQFIIDKDGKIIEPKIHESAGNTLDNHALDIIRKAPKWIPARQHNRLVKAYRRQPITFNLEEE